jgi:ribosomal-protein-alanine N-acetyltransferase
MGGVLLQQDAEARMIGILHQWEESTAGLWAVCKREKGDLIGLCGFGMFESETEVIYKLFPVFWGHGYATEATAASLAYGFQTLQLDRIIGVTQEANQRSQRVLEKLGMRQRCTLWKWEAAQRVYELNRTVWLTEQKSLETM